MAFNSAPTNLLGAGYVADTTKIDLLLANFPEVTAAEADEATGDSRKVLFGLLTAIHNRYAALAAADKPAKLRISKSSSALGSGNGFTQTFTISFDLSAGAVEVVAES